MEDNKTRETGLRSCENAILARQASIEIGNKAWRERGVLLVEAAVRKASSGTAQLSIEEQEKIRSIPASKLGVHGNLICVVGASYMVGQNADVAKGIANGTICTLVDVILENDDKITTTVTKEGYHIHTVTATNVKCMIFQHSTKAWQEQLLFNSLPQGCFPVLPVCKKTFHQFGGSGTRMQVKVTQLPVVLSKIVTGHKLQGQTVSHIVLANLQKHKNGSSGWLYVVLSRVSSINGFFTLTRIPEDPRFYKPRLDVKKEMVRLREIELKTVKRLELANTC